MAPHNMTVEIHQGKRIARFNFCAEGNCWYHFRIFEDGKVIATGKGRTIEKIYPRMVKYLKAQQTEPATPPASVDPELPESWRGYRAPAEQTAQPELIELTDDDLAEAADRLLDVDRRDLRAELIEALIATDSMPIPQSPNHDRNERRYGQGGIGMSPCRVCGKPTRVDAPTTRMIHEHMGGGVIVTERLAALLDSASDLGGQVIGPECWRNHPEIARFLGK